MAEGLIVLSGETTSTGTSGFGILLENGRFVITTGSVVYTAPWMIFRTDGAGGTSLSITRHRVVVAGHAASSYGEIVFECDFDTINGRFFRTKDSVNATMVLPPDRLTFESGQTELPFSITFSPVNDIDNIERPDWVESARSQ